jgi:hypothetical protein
LIVLPLPVAPYASEGGMVARRVPPTFMPATASSNPLINVPAPTTNVSWLASNCWPL